MDIDALKQAAIDAYMRSEGYQRQGGGSYFDYGLGFSATVGSDGTGVATYSTSSGSGMPVTSNVDLDYRTEWGEVRDRVDTALEQWQDDRLPEPSALNGGMVTAQAAVTALNMGSQNSYGGALGGYYKTISDNASEFRGAAMDAFNNSFVNQLPAVISNHGCLAAIVTEAWAAEKEIWTQARADRDTHVEKATAALDSYAESEGTSEIKFLLGLTGAALAGASAIASGGVTLPFALATAGITSLSATNDYVGELRLERSGDSYQDLMAAFESGLDDIDEAITQQETLVREGLENGWQTFEAHRALFDLTPRVSDDGDGGWGDETSIFDVTDAGALAVVIPGEAVVGSLSSGMKNLAHGLEDADPKIIAGAEEGGLLSPSAREVGLRYNGVAIMMWIVGDNTAASIRDLTWDVRNSEAMLRAIVTDFTNADAASQAGLDDLRGQLVGGSGEDPWR
ncbi:hypothetical protein FE634_00405 [Nocardioides dongxiaopingii]|uniref:hypothetical protein n=1 Tax=Nocardioides sp. S-1144 TaxID=2582905 RepID=UPI00110EF9FA|nr:hypothetical protein [Nocardioides sp. S-1144]QCW49259.1 hypothetical protein FE634_00405 [Nocardioides sp. S-1144]